MKKKILLVFFSFIVMCSLFSADKLAVAEPVAKAGISSNEIEMLWSILESSIKSDEYTLVSRSALKQILTEIGLTNSSGLVNLNSTQKAKLGQIDSVKYILVTELGKFGSRYNCTLRIIDSSTGEIDQARTYNLRIKNLDELADKIEVVLEKLLSDEKNKNISCIIFPIVKDRYARRDAGAIFNAYLEEHLLSKGVRLRNLQAAVRILQKNNIPPLRELEPSLYKKVGDLLDSKYLIQVILDRCSVVTIDAGYNQLLRKNITYKQGSVSGRIKILYGTKNEILHISNFNYGINFQDLDIDTDGWGQEDYETYLLKAVIPAVCKDFENKIK